MGKYLINGSKYEIDESIQGADLDRTLAELAGQPPKDPKLSHIDSYLAETDRLLNLTPGTSARQINQESKFDPMAVSPKGARGLAQVIPATVDSLSQRLGRKLDPHNTDDALVMHRELMRENMAKFGNEDDALRAYNAGWNPKTWNNPETRQYVQKIKGQTAADEVAPAKAPFVPFATVRDKVDPATLNQDQDWLSASRQLYSLRERQAFTGSDADLAEWGKSFMGNFNSNMLDMTRYAADLVKNGTDQDKRAFVWMMDTYDNTVYSWEGAGRAAKGMLTDPTNLVGLSTLGVGSVGKVMASAAAKQGVKRALLEGLGRTGIIAGVESGVLGAAQDSIQQGVKVDAGAQDSVSLPQVAAHGAIGAAAGTVLGTAGDAAFSAIANVVRRNMPTRAPGRAVEGRIEPALGDVPPAASGAPTAPPGAGPAGSVAPGVVPPVASPATPADPASVAHWQSLRDRALGVPSGPEVTPPAALPGSTVEAPALPRDLAGAKPRWKTSELTFESDIDKALFIVSQTKKSARDGDYRVWLKSLGMTDEEITTNSAAVRAALKGAAEGADGPVHLPTVTEHGTPVPEASPATPSGAGAPPAGGGTPPPAGPDLAPNTALTEAEIAAARARKQDGRLWVDDLPPVTPANPEARASIDVPERNTGLRSTPRSMEELTRDGMQIADQLRNLDDRTLHGVLESFRNGAETLEDARVIARGVQIHADELRVEQAEIIKKLGLSTNAQETVRLLNRQQEVESRLVPLSLADDAYGSMAGSMLRQRQEGLPGLQGVTIESLMVDRNLPRAAAENLYAELIQGSQQTVRVQSINRSYDSRIAAAIERGDMMELAMLTAMRQRELAAVVETDLPGSATFMQKLTEFTISNVFSPTTVAINLIPAAAKTLILPAAKALVNNPLRLATRVELAANYGAMKSTFGAALRAARAAFRYEQSLVTRGSGRILEGEMAIEGAKAGWIRFLPRVLNATDEFLAQINYASFVSGNAAGHAATEGSARGLTGTALTDHIRQAAETAMAHAYTPQSGEALIQPLVNKGVNLGLTGEDLLQYVEREALRDPEALRHGADEVALDQVRDVLYKRKFSGEGTASGVAQSYEQAMNRAPSMKLVLGQLFFRTPIRVFEEGIRLTPGVQFLAPGFISDLAGRNGTIRQARAQAEAMTSLALTGAVFSLYASGSITGDGAYDNWKQARTGADGPGAPAYTIKMRDGSTWSYRNFDPIATPIKIMVNGLERMDKLAVRQAQGEQIAKGAWDQALAYVTTGTMSIAAALKDANLVAGVDQMIKFGQDLADPEGKEDAWIKMFGEKLALLVPNTLHKLAKENDPTIKDPANFWQVVETRLAALHVDREEIKTAYAYDMLGNVRQITDTGTLWNIFSTATPEERAKGHSEETQKVMLELDRLQRETGAVFSPPLKNKLTGDFDLRTTLTKDGKETLYDRWQANFRDLHPETILYPIVTAEMPDGTFKQKAMRVETVNKVLNELREAAFVRMMSEEQSVINQVIDHEVNKAKAQSGLLDFSNRNK